ncbi:MAG TPA: aryl-sulfate sulfotransferase [Chitinophagales bacterium]|nr:aryl-sulfate sulfotransferase [Chitinophagales bacterium]
MKLAFLFLLVAITSHSTYAQFQYLSPVPGSTFINTEHNIVIREGHYINPAFLKNDLFIVHGSRSGNHACKMVLCADGKTIVLTPSSPFLCNEEVIVTINKGLRTSERQTVTPYSFNFFTHREYTAEEKERIQNDSKLAWRQELEDAGSPSNEESGDTRSAITGSFQIVVNTSPSPGLIFFDAFNGLQAEKSIYDGIHIITTNGDSVYSSAGQQYLLGDWDLNPSGDLSFPNTDSGRFDVLDSNYNLIDSYTPANGYELNGHEFTKYSNGHVFMIADETQIMDLTGYDPGYSKNASVKWGVIQEFDENKNLVFEWRSFDHVGVTETNQNLHLNQIDVAHTNSIELDADGNIIVSHRDLNQVMKIDHSTGAFIWRLGGQMNQFTFVNDAEQFNYQHDARILSNGHLTLWDNGNGHTVHHSSAKEYQLDVVNHIATLVWSYAPVNTANGNAAYYSAMGNVQRLSNGNTFINCGYDFSTTQPNMIEVTPEGQIVWELLLNNDSYLVSYRAHHRDWNPCAPVNQNSIAVKKITASSAKITWEGVSNAVSYDVQYRKLGKVEWKLKNTTGTSKKLMNLMAEKSYEFQVRAHCANAFTCDWSPIDTFKTAPLKLFVPEETQPSGILKLYPNPVNDVFTIEWNSDEDASAIISIFDLSGKLMLTISGFNADDESLQVNASSLPSGLYFAEMSFGNTKQKVQFTKQ